jgi:AcrR family transcriptional regulator
MTRTYTLRRRAEQQTQTRQRIAEAALELHGTVGPARTTLSMIAERAGVQRHTLYAHFPDERSLFMACSGLAEERDPSPDAAEWRNIVDGRERLAVGLGAIYAWYERNASLLAVVLRDAEHHVLTRETSELRYGPVLASWREVLSAGLGERQRALLELALSFHSWRTLTTQARLSTEAAVELMVRSVGECDRG